MERLNYRVEDSTIAELLGVQNFTNEQSAVLELVKNAYDAQAKHITILFANDSITLTDDGTGMDADDIRLHWMYVGRSDKGYYSDADIAGKQRILAGSKGVGRFALARLGAHVELFSHKEGCQPVQWVTDWGQAFLSEGEGDSPKFTRGTKITIWQLRDRWTSHKIMALIDYLSITYNNKEMEILVLPQQKRRVNYIFSAPKQGITHVSQIDMRYNGKGMLVCEVNNDEFNDDAKKYCGKINIQQYTKSVDIFSELSGDKDIDLPDEELRQALAELGYFESTLFFSLKSSTKSEKERFLYKYDTLSERYDYGVVLYRNAFSITSFEGKQDWLELNKRVRQSPAAATHPTGAWRVRANQISGYVLIDKLRNSGLKDLTNRQGLERNVYYRLFVKIITIGISLFERYRQSIIRKINVKNQIFKPNLTPSLDEIYKKPTMNLYLTKEKVQAVKREIGLLKKESDIAKRQKEEAEDRYHYDVRILNTFVTIGLKAAAIAHEAGNDRNSLSVNYDYIVEALKEYGLWDLLNSPEKTRHSYNNVPALLKRAKDINQKTYTFIDTMLEEVEKKRFQHRTVNVKDQIDHIIDFWKRDYSNLDIEVQMTDDQDFETSPDVFATIFDNLILNTWQQNHRRNGSIHIVITGAVKNGKLEISYHDDGKGLDAKYLDDPMRILEVHETSRENGHGLGMWIVNNTIQMTGGRVIAIDGHDGFLFRFDVGGGL